MKSTAWIAALMFAASSMLPASVAAELSRQGTVYKNPWCGCCESHVAYLRDHGYVLDIVHTEALDEIRADLGVPLALAGCHLIVIDGYIVEGHVPVSSIERLLSERPNIAGISLPGMPQGSPGMSGTKEEPFVILEIGEGDPVVFAVE